MAKINKALTMLQTEYYQILPDKQEFFKEQFMKFNKCSASTFSRRLRIGDSLDDLALFQYIFGTKIFQNSEVIEKRFAESNVKKFDHHKNQFTIFNQITNP